MSPSTRSDLPLNTGLKTDTPTPSIDVLTARHVSLKHILVALLLSALFFLLFCFIVLHGYIAWVLSNPNVAPLYSNPKLSKNLAYEDVLFQAADGSRMMQGWYIPAENSRKTIVFSHGYGANREEPWVPMYDLAHYANRLNYNVLMFDYGFASQKSKEVATGGKKKPSNCLGPSTWPNSEALMKSSYGDFRWAQVRLYKPH